MTTKLTNKVLHISVKWLPLTHCVHSSWVWICCNRLSHTSNFCCFHQISSGKMPLKSIIVSFHTLFGSPFSPLPLKDRNHKLHYIINKKTLGWKCLLLDEKIYIYLSALLWQNLVMFTLQWKNVYSEYTTTSWMVIVFGKMLWNNSLPSFLFTVLISHIPTQL